jgi:hypothetical protein
MSNPGVIISPAPTDEEAAAIAAAVEFAWPRPVIVISAGPRPTAAGPWRWSGRWWAEGLQSRRG